MKILVYQGDKLLGCFKDYKDRTDFTVPLGSKYKRNLTIDFTHLRFVTSSTLLVQEEPKKYKTPRYEVVIYSYVNRCPVAYLGLVTHKGKTDFSYGTAKKLEIEYDAKWNILAYMRKA